MLFQSSVALLIFLGEQGWGKWQSTRREPLFNQFMREEFPTMIMYLSTSPFNFAACIIFEAVLIGTHLGLLSTLDKLILLSYEISLFVPATCLKKSTLSDTNTVTPALLIIRILHG